MDADEHRQRERHDRQRQAIAYLEGAHEQDEKRQDEQRVKQPVGEQVVAVREIGDQLDRREPHRPEVAGLRRGVPRNSDQGDGRAHGVEQRRQRVANLQRHVQQVVPDADRQHHRRGEREQPEC